MELGTLTMLKTLHLNDNQLTGPIPAVVGTLAELTELHLDSNQISGVVPDELSNLSMVTFLRMCPNNNLAAGPTAENWMLNVSNSDWVAGGC